MDLLDELRAFVATAQSGSFTAAADQLGVSNRLTSKYVGALETRLGVRLFQRTTRQVGLTPVGEDLLARVPAVLDDLDAILSEVSERSMGHGGLIRVSAPVTFGELYVGPMLARFGAEHPGLRFDLRMTDRFVDLASEGIDLAFRIGTLTAQSLKSRKLGESRALVVAAPDYLKRYGAPQTPADLPSHSCILDTNRSDPKTWRFGHGGQAQNITVEGRYQVNSARAAVQLATSGLGLAFVPRFALCEALSAGQLVPLLEAYETPPFPVNAVYLEGRVVPPRIRDLIEFARKDLADADLL